MKFIPLIVLLGAPVCSAQLAPPVLTPGGGLVVSPALIRVTNPNPAGAIFYTLNGPDPRDHFGSVTGKAGKYQEPFSINRSTVVRARVKAGAQWSDLVVGAFTADQDFSKLLFTELMYHPRDTDDEAEFVELKNVGAVPLDLSGLGFRISGALPSFTFRTGTVIEPGGFRVLVRGPAAYRALHPNARIDGIFADEMENSVAFLRMAAANGAIAAEMSYYSAAPWQVVPDNHGYFPDDGVGFSLVRTTLDPEADPHDHRTWRASTVRYGSPGADDPPPVVPPIYISELLTRASAGVREAIEFFNPNPIEVHIGGWWLSDERNFPYRYPIPMGTIVPPLGYLVIDESQFSAGDQSVSFSADGERCYLFSGDLNGMLTGYSHGFQFSASDRDVSFGRHLAGDGSETFPPQSSRTIGAPNSGPRVSPVVISEVMYEPAPGGMRYLELRNTTDAPVQLWDPQAPSAAWAVGMYYSRTPLPTNVTIPAQGHLLLVDGEPDAFRSMHNPPATVPIFRHRPFPTTFDGEPVELSRPSGSSGGLVRHVTVDQIDYRNRAPWPPGANGTGDSIERIDLHGRGTDSGNWRICPNGSPGLPNAGNLPPRVWAGGPRVELAGRPSQLSGAVADDRSPGATLSSTWSQISGPAVVEFSNPSLESVTAMFPAPGEYAIRLTANDGEFTGSDVLAVEVVAPPFETWRAAEFTAAELADPAISGASADPDGDGIRNDAEYFFGSDPNSAGSAQRTVASIVGGRLQIEWTQRTQVPDMVAVPERADRLEGPWFSAAELFEKSAEAQGGLTNVAVRERLPLSGRGQGFLRLRLLLR